MPLSRWYVLAPCLYPHNTTYFVRILSKHKMWDKNMENYYYIWWFLSKNPGRGFISSAGIRFW